MGIAHGVFGNLLKHGVLQVLHAARDRAEALLGEFEEHASAWAGRVALKYCVAIALAVGALGSLSGAAKEGLIAAGLPPWAAQLLLGLLMAGGALFLFKSHGGKSRHKRNDDQEESTSSSSKFAIHIHPPGHPEPPRPRPRARSRGGRHRVVRVKHLRKGWQVETGLHHRKKRLFDNKRLAMKAARSAARKASAEVVVLGTGKKAHRVVERQGVGVEHAA